jgi:putative aldouronate transport system substrate-binding protein
MPRTKVQVLPPLCGKKEVKMKKRFVAMILCTLLMISMMGCSGNTTEPSATPSKERTTLSMFSFDEGMKDIINDSSVFQKLMEKTGVNLELEVVSGVNTDEKRSIMIAGGEYPDILDRIDERFIDAEALIPLDDLIEEYGPNIKRVWGDSINKLRHTDGKIYFLGSPKNRPELLIDSGSCLLVQYDVLEQLGYPTPKTLDDVFDMLTEYTSNHMEINGQPFIPWGIWADSW